LTLFAFLLGLVLVLELVLLILAVSLFQRRFGASSQLEALKQLADQAEAMRQNLSAQFASATADTAMRLEQTKGAIGLQVADRLGDGFSAIRSAVEEQMKAGRSEQSEGLAQARTELTSSLALTTAQLKSEFDGLNQKTAQSLDSIRDRVDARLLDITDQVQQKLDQNIKEGLPSSRKCSST
jgi:DNA anti-recombination protein RmuC